LLLGHGVKISGFRSVPRQQNQDLQITLRHGLRKEQEDVILRLPKKGVGMITNEITARIAELQEEIQEVHEERRKLIMDFGINLGTTSTGGINLTELGEWAREVIKLNAEMAELAGERRTLRAARKELAPCECNCH
jgi:hypothetical protein